jgi:hypothetical protein
VEVPKETEREIKEGDVAPILERRTELVRVQTGILAIDAAVGGGFVAGRRVREKHYPSIGCSPDRSPAGEEGLVWEQ